jgi:aminopeptidase YwaD
MGRLKRGISILFLLMSANFAFAQAYDQKVADYILRVEHPLTFLQKIEKFGIKEPGKKGLDSTFFWLKELIEKDGYKTVTQNFVYGTDTLRNLLFSKKGDIDSCIIIGAHYDSKIGAGVNDNGTGNFALYQIAKLLKPLQTKYTVRFVFFIGEEIDYL